MDGCMSVLFLLSLLFVGLTAERRFIDFQPGFEYVYSFSGYTDVKELGKFLVNAKVPLSLSIYIYLSVCLSLSLLLNGHF